MFNKVILIGNLVDKPILRVTSSNTPVTNLRIAVNSKVGQETETLFITVVVFGTQAQNCYQYLEKGDPILVEGRLRQRERTEQKTQMLEVVATRVKFMPRRKKEQTEATKTPHEIDTLEEEIDLEAF